MPSLHPVRPQVPNSDRPAELTANAQVHQSRGRIAYPPDPYFIGYAAAENLTILAPTLDPATGCPSGDFTVTLNAQYPGWLCADRGTGMSAIPITSSGLGQQVLI